MNIKQIYSQVSATINRSALALLLAKALNKPRAYLYSHPEIGVTPQQLDSLHKWFKRMEQGEPLEYILGEAEFYGFLFEVNAAVLVPRPETEMLVDLVSEIGKIPQYSILELGTGSGAIAITLGKRNPSWDITATDISEEALAVARKNAKQHHVNNIHFIPSDWFSSLMQREYDLIVSNPPYIAEEDPHLAALRFEPQGALVSGHDGLNDIRHIIATASSYLKSEGWIFLEHGYEQSEAVRECFRQHAYREIKTKRDLSGHPRVTIAKKG